MDPTDPGSEAPAVLRNKIDHIRENSMDSTDAPQIIEHINTPLNFTPFDVKWVPNSARLTVVGEVSLYLNRFPL